jgi:tetratricopeptide (TPR) repeat protein
MDATTLDHLINALDTGKIAPALQEYKHAASTDESVRRVGAFVNSALAHLALELCQAAIRDCNYALQIDSYFTLSYLVKGFACLWSLDEEGGVRAWDERLSHGGLIHFFCVMKRLVIDPNFRARLFSKRFDVGAFLNIVEELKENPDRVYTDSDTQQAFASLRANQPLAAISHFSAILMVDTENVQAYKGRGVAHCLVSQYGEAILDVDRAVEAKVDVVESSKFRAMASAAIGCYSAAVSDLSFALARFPLDSEALAERGKIQLSRQMYSLALADSERIPDEQKDWASLAEAYYGLGNLEKARLAIEQLGDQVCQRGLYVHYLVLKDLGFYELAVGRLVRAAAMLPSYFLLRCAAEFMFYLGRIQEAAGYCSSALDQKPNDLECN